MLVMAWLLTRRGGGREAVDLMGGVAMVTSGSGDQASI